MCYTERQYFPRKEATAVRTRSLRLAAYLLYALGCVIYIVYFLRELDAAVRMTPFERILLLGAGSLCIYFGSFSLTKTVEPHAAKLVMKSTFRTFFVLYLLLLVTFTLFDDVFGRGTNTLFVWQMGKSWAELRRSINLVPLHTIRLYFRSYAAGLVTLRDFLINMVGNLLAFMPFALFLPLLFPRLDRTWRFFLTVTAIVLLIEALQFILQRGFADVDDLLLNVGGAMLLYGILRLPLFRRIIRRYTLQ